MRLAAVSRLCLAVLQAFALLQVGPVAVRKRCACKRTASGDVAISPHDEFAVTLVLNLSTSDKDREAKS